MSTAPRPYISPLRTSAGGAEGRQRPGRFVAHRHHIGMAGEHQMRAVARLPCIEVLDIRRAVFREGRPVGRKTHRREHFGQRRQRRSRPASRMGSGSASQGFRRDRSAVSCGTNHRFVGRESQCGFAMRKSTKSKDILRRGPIDDRRWTCRGSIPSPFLLARKQAARRHSLRYGFRSRPSALAVKPTGNHKYARRGRHPAVQSFGKRQALSVRCTFGERVDAMLDKVERPSVGTPLLTMDEARLREPGNGALAMLRGWVES